MNFLATIFGLVEILLYLQTGLVNCEESTSPHIGISSRIAEFKLNLHKLMEGSRIRKKRGIQETDGPPNKRMRVGRSSQENLPYLSDYRLTFWISLEHHSERQVLIGTQQGDLILFELSQSDDTVGRLVSHTMEEHVASKATAFSHYNDQWFVLRQSAGNSTWIRLYQRIGRGLERKQTINLEGDADFHLITVKGVHYLAVVSHLNSYEYSLDLYRWKRTQFDVIASRTVHGPSSITCWVMDGALYLAVAQEFNLAGDFSVGSPIYLFNAKEEGGLVLLEMLSTYGPKKVLHFYVSGSNYVIFIGRREAEIYWWSNDQFLLWQRIDGTAFASDVSVLTLENGEVVIVIAMKEEAFFYTLDASGHYIRTFILLFKDANLASLQFMFSGKGYYALALFAAAYGKTSQSVWKLNLAPHDLPGQNFFDQPKRCFKEVTAIVNERQQELDNVNIKLNQVWLKNSNQTITSEVAISGEIQSIKQSIIHQVLVLIERKIIPDPSMSEVEYATSRLISVIEKARNDIRSSVSKTIKQDIIGAKHFQGIVSIPSLTMNWTNVDVPVNDVPVSRLYQYALRRVGDQTFRNPMVVHNADSKEVVTQAFNNKEISDFVLLKNKQEITGILKFNSVVVNDAKGGSINYISVDDLVTTNSHQHIRDLKRISHLQSVVIEVSGQTNGEDLNELSKKIVTSHETEELFARSLIHSTMYVNGDIFLTGSVNGDISISQLDVDSVKENTEQTLKGSFVFTKPLSVTGNVHTGLVNGARLDHLMTKSTPQALHGNVVFNELTINRDLIIDYLNGIDLDETAVLMTTDPQSVSGTKIFVKPLVADFIEMKDYATLDGVDPSFLVQNIINHREGHVHENNTVFHNVIVLGNLTAIEGANGRDIEDLSESVWLKSKTQVIEVPVKFDKVSTEQDLQVQVINTIHLDEDVVRTYGEETIVSVKSFVHQTTLVENVETAVGALINGFDVVSYRKEMDRYVEEGKILGKKRLQKLEIFGNVDANIFNKYQINDILQPQIFQEIEAHVHFASELTTIKSHFRSENVWFQTVNGMNLDAYIEGAVSKSSPKYIVKSKTFSSLVGQHFVLRNGSSLSRVAPPDMFARIVTLDTKQQIQSEKMFQDTLFLQMASTARHMNDKEWVKFSNNVVLTDELSTVSSPKLFNGHIQAATVFNVRNLSGIDINLLNQTAFLRTVNNEINQHTVFIGDLDIGTLVVESELDGMNWDNLIFLFQDEALDRVWFLSDSSLLANLKVGGVIERCNLTEFGQRALYAIKGSQKVFEEVTIQSIQVVGNLNLKDIVNQIKIEDLQKRFISVHGDQIITSDVKLGSGFRVVNLDLKHNANHVNVPFIMNDAVRHSFQQVIGGTKTFLDVSTNRLTTPEVFVIESLDGVDINKLYLNAVWKVDSQIIEGEKIFHSLKANAVVLHGYINGLNLPSDVVKVDVSEHLSSPVFFMSDLVLGTDLIVHGRIDGVDVPYLLDNKVSLLDEEVVLSGLILKSDVRLLGESIINGTVNDLALEQVVCRIRQNLPLEGFKVFVQDLNVFGSLQAPIINGLDIGLLDQNILRYNREETINDLQEFKTTVKTNNSLYTQWINNIHFPQLIESFYSIRNNFSRTRDYLHDLNFNFELQINHQKQASGNQISKFAYFVLVQEILVGPVIKILYGSEFNHHTSEFSHTMVIWSSQKHCSYMERCCNAEFSYWMRVKKSGHLMVDGNETTGRLYPIHDPAPVSIDKDFVIWTNTTDVQSKWCSGDWNEKMHLTSLSDSGYYEVFMEIRNAPILSEIKTFRQEHLYAIAGFFYDKREDEYSSAVVYLFNEIERKWRLHQTLPSYGVLSLDLASYSDNYREELLLAIGTGMDKDSAVYRWSTDGRQFEIVQRLPSRYVTSTLWMQHELSPLLAMASVDHWPKKGEDCMEFLSGGQIDIYDYGERIRRIQVIPLRGVVSMLTFKLEDDLFLIAASHQLQSIFIYEWKGYAGFSLIQTMFVGEVRHINSFTIDEDIYMTVAITSGPSKLMKIILQGRHSLSVSTENIPTNKEQRDQSVKDPKLGTGCLD